MGGKINTGLHESNNQSEKSGQKLLSPIHLDEKRELNMIWSPMEEDNLQTVQCRVQMRFWLYGA